MNYNDSVMQVRVEDINHVYTQLKGRPRSALQHVSLEIPDGQFVCILGPSGCGKSTLLRILAGLLEPTSGSVLLDDNAPDQALALKQIGWMAQNPALLPWRTVEQNIALAQTVNPQNGRRLLSPAELLTLMRLDDVARAYPAALSGGMQHRTALARTIALGARLWLMDEPFAALDEFTRTALADELIAIWGAFRTTVVWVTHHVYEAVRLADRILVMSHVPGTVINDFPVQLARPRLESDPEFTALAASVRAAAGSAAEAGSPPLSTPYAKQILGSI